MVSVEMGRKNALKSRFSKKPHVCLGSKNMISVEEGMEIGPKIRVSLNYKFSSGLRTWSEWRRAGKSAVKLI